MSFGCKYLNHIENIMIFTEIFPFLIEISSPTTLNFNLIHYFIVFSQTYFLTQGTIFANKLHKSRFDIKN